MILPNWPVQDKVGALSTTRSGGASTGSFSSFNLGYHVGDERNEVVANHQYLRTYLPAQAIWLEQIHGDRVFVVNEKKPVTQWPQADALYTNARLQPLAIMTADCLPILLASKCGGEVAAVHGGWRPLAAGILANTLVQFKCDPDDIFAWLGPAIGPKAFEVGSEVVAQFCNLDSAHCSDFVEQNTGKYLADIFAIATRQLAELGVTKVYTDKLCTVSDSHRFFSYRRDGQTGRMASVIWRN
ncbi:yfiH [Pseudoalteromonas citrea]|uniref:Purine nucleoside phosphorylase n=2 Tax=Pseudoalteromonas citrea TaxID=43655 RepID=A0AAD4AKZ6_9GAMM|nr:peptidoglycan editing factor PgeF [Pseudoalteromonas citrea]KAF7774253.1 yfiH [Pseudoalteromonas citrea]